MIGLKFSSKKKKRNIPEKPTDWPVLCKNVKIEVQSKQNKVLE